MSQNAIMKRVEMVLTHILTLVDGTQHTLIPVDPHGTVMDMPEGEDFWVGKLLDGGSIEVPSSQVLMIERDRYRVTVNNGQGNTSRDVSEKQLNRAIDNAPRNQETGEVEMSWKTIKDRKTGETIDLD